MPSVTSAYTAPQSIAWTNNAGNSYGPHMLVDSTGTAVRLSRKVRWRSNYATFQVQWRTRQRKAPGVAIVTDPTGADVWSDWSAWAGSDDSTSTPFTTTAADGTVTADTTVDLSYDMTAYDLTEVEVRVRVINATAGTCSAWSTSTLKIHYLPTLTLTGTLQADGSLSVAVSSNFLRTQTLRINQVYSDTRVKVSKIGLATWTWEGSSATFTLDAPYVYNNLKVYAFLIIDGYDGHSAIYPVTIGSYTPPTISEPSVAFTDTKTHTVLTVTGTYSAVAASVSWTDGLGHDHFEVLDVKGSGPFTATVEAPPLGVEATYRVSCITASGWKAWTYTHTIDADEMRLSDGEVCFCIEYDPKRSLTASPHTEVVELADGSTVSRHGMGSGRELPISGALVPDGDWIDAAELLDGAHDWWLRTTYGDRIRVAITQWSLAERDDEDHTLDISISTKEVR